MAQAKGSRIGEVYCQEGGELVFLFHQDILLFTPLSSCVDVLTCGTCLVRSTLYYKVHQYPLVLLSVPPVPRQLDLPQYQVRYTRTAIIMYPVHLPLVGSWGCVTRTE